jgi:hypothetical protein
MNSLIIRYQTSELLPAPFAHSIEIAIEYSADKLKYDIEVIYLDRENLSEEEIWEEGFTGDDDKKLSGNLGKTWTLALNNLLKNTKRLYLTEIKEEEEYWEIIDEKDKFYPKNSTEWKNFLSEIEQASIEQNQIERPLEIQIVRQNEESQKKYIVFGSFENREFRIVNPDNKTTVKDWNELNLFLKSIFAGDFVYEKATESIPKKQGIFINMGDGVWFEVGKSLLIQPSKITSWIENL